MGNASGHSGTGDDLRQPLIQYFCHIYDKHFRHLHIPPPPPPLPLRILLSGNPPLTRLLLLHLHLLPSSPSSSSPSGDPHILTQFPHHSDPSLPLIFHDSTGGDADIPRRTALINDFLHSRLSGDSITDRIHAVWYVLNFSADDFHNHDSRILEVLDDGYGEDLVLLLLIVIRKDIDGPEKMGIINMEEEEEEEEEAFLRRISGSDPERHKRLKESMVRVYVGNSPDSCSITKRLLGDRTEKEVVAKVAEKRRSEWAELQAAEMNVEAKVDATAKLMRWNQIGLRLATLAVGFIPVVHEMVLRANFRAARKGLSEIWGAAENLQEAIDRKFLEKERREARWRDIVRLLSALAFVGSMALSVLGSTEVLAEGASRSWRWVVGTVLQGVGFMVACQMLMAWMEWTSNHTISYSLRVVGVIIYVNLHVPRPAEDREIGVMEHYVQHCEDFLWSSSTQWADGIMSDIEKGKWRSSLRPLIHRFLHHVIVKAPQSLLLSNIKEE